MLACTRDVYTSLPVPNQIYPFWGICMKPHNDKASRVVNLGQSAYLLRFFSKFFISLRLFWLQSRQDWKSLTDVSSKETLVNNFSVLTYLTDITMTITIITFYYWNFILVHYIRLGLDSFWGYHHVSQQLYYLSDIRTSPWWKLLPINLSSLSLRSEGFHSSILMLFFPPTALRI